MAWGSNLSNAGRAYRIGGPMFNNMQGMLPMAGLQPGGRIGTGQVPILGAPMLPPGVTKAQAALPAMLPGLGAALPVPKVMPTPAPVTTTTPKVLPWVDRRSGGGGKESDRGSGAAGRDRGWNDREHSEARSGGGGRRSGGGYSVR